MNPIQALLAAMVALGAVYASLWGRAIMAARRLTGRGNEPASDARMPTAFQIGLGAVTNFLDSLGIGSFATTTAAFRFKKMVPDRIIPGTLNVGHTVPTVVEAFVYMSIIPVDVVTLVSMIAASMLGAWLGAGVVAHWSRRKVQIGMGLALLAAATLMLLSQFQMAARRRRRARRARREARDRARRQLRARRAHDARDRPLRAVHDPRRACSA